MPSYPKRHNFTRYILALIAVLPLALGGCVSQPAPEAKKTAGPIFYPPLPEPPRYQFLTSFNGKDDFSTKAGGLDSFLGGKKNKNEVLKKPYGVTIRNGVIYLGDTSAGVFLFDLNKKKFGPFPGSVGPGKVIEPINVTSDPEGNIYVCDPVRAQVLEYNANNQFIRGFSSPDKWKPVDAQVFEGKLYVADSTRMTGGIKVFDLKSGKQVSTIGRKGTPEQTLGIAYGLAFYKDGYLYVVDAYHFMVMKYDRDGHFRGGLGGVGDSPGFFGRPRGIAIDHNGRMYVVDAAYDVVQVFSNTGQLLTYFGNETGQPGSLTLPAAVDIDYDNINLFKQYAAPGFQIEYLILITSQFNKHQAINVYAYGRMQGAKYQSDQQLYQEMLEKMERDKGKKLSK